MVRYGVWLFLGLATGLLQAALIVHTVACLTPLAMSRVRFRIILRSLLRFALALLVMAGAIQVNVAACALAGLGLLAGRWLLVVVVVSGRMAGSRL